MDELNKKRQQLADPEAYLSALTEQQRAELSDTDIKQLKQEYLFEKSLAKAFAVNVDPQFADRIILQQRLSGKKNATTKFSWSSKLAIAASFLLVSILSFNYVNHSNSNVIDLSLSKQALAHVYGEISLLDMTLPKNQKTIDPQIVQQSLKQMAIDLPHLPFEVLSVGKCGFAGNKAMHLVARIDGKPVTLLITPNKSQQSISFSDNRFIGKVRQIANASFVLVGEDSISLDKLFSQLSGV
jgi:hypothetical protein